MPKNVEKSFERERLLDDNAELYRFLHFCYSVLKPLVIAAKVKRYLRVKNAHKLLHHFKAPCIPVEAGRQLA